jgi:hypothetical protein
MLMTEVVEEHGMKMLTWIRICMIRTSAVNGQTMEGSETARR